jgi:hypothetical protein
MRCVQSDKDLLLYLAVVAIAASDRRFPAKAALGHLHLARVGRVVCGVGGHLDVAAARH